MTSVVDADRLTVSYEQPVLRKVSMSVSAGEFVALMGANGSGKSTLIKALLGLVKPDSGTASLFGEPLSKFRDWQRVAYVPQRLLAGSAVPLSVEETVRSALTSPRRRGRPLGRRGHQHVRGALEKVSLWDRRRDSFDTLSGGQQRRVMIARGLATNAELLILDEPTAGVDRSEQQRLARTFAHLHAAGATLILITHDLGPVADLATRAIVLGPPDGKSVRYDGPTPPPREWTETVWHHSHDEPPPGDPWLEGL